MKFIVRERKNPEYKNLIYREDEYSFDSRPRPDYGYTSILVNELQIEIDSSGRLCYVWGYCPLINYDETDNYPVDCSSCSVVAILGKKPIAGISQSVNENERWPVFINKKLGWVCLGNPHVKDKRMIEFAPNCVVALDGQELVALWLHPEVIRHETGSGLTN